jgi:membrane fusion protein (multidrug efflux system)
MLSYTVITAPSDGLVSKVNVQPGQFVQQGQMLFAVVLNSDIWVVGNFKETQINKMREGQEVIVHADAFPGHEFKARLASFSLPPAPAFAAASGQCFRQLRESRSARACAHRIH